MDGFPPFILHFDSFLSSPTTNYQPFFIFGPVVSHGQTIRWGWRWLRPSHRAGSDFTETLQFSPSGLQLQRAIGCRESLKVYCEGNRLKDFALLSFSLE